MSQENPLDIGAKDRDRRRRMARGVSAQDTDELDMPLNNFFGDDLLMILYRTEANNFASARVRTSLQIVSDKNKPRHIRALSAVQIGRFVKQRADDSHDFGTSDPKEWFALARQLNSIVGAFELANMMLEDRELQVELDLKTDPLPRLMDTRVESKRTTSGIDRDIEKSWYLGARVAMRHRQREFDGWDDEMFRCAFACIINYLSLPPSSRFATDKNESIKVRRHALNWIKPLWNALIVAASKRHYASEKLRMALVEQQLVVLNWLDELERNPLASRLNTGPAPVTPEANQAVIISGVIPTSSDRSDNDYLKAFEILRHPMDFRELASIDVLREVQTKLECEFPWAVEVIEVVMSELIARKSHGATRLGMSPILLVGTPGTGKTRFAQRLSKLLGTPSTVINLAGMSDVKVLKGVTRGWSSNRPSRMVEFITQNKVPNPLFILDEIDKSGSYNTNGGDPQEALLDLLEPGNAQRYQDIYLMTECNLSHCLYVATSNSLAALPEPLLSRLHPVYFPAPGPEHGDVIAQGIVRDLEVTWGLPQGAIFLSAWDLERLRGLMPREMRRAIIGILAVRSDERAFARH